MRIIRNWLTLSLGTLNERNQSFNKLFMHRITDKVLYLLPLINQELLLVFVISVSYLDTMQEIVQYKDLSNQILLDLPLEDVEGVQALVMVLLQEDNLSPLEGEEEEEGGTNLLSILIKT